MDKVCLYNSREQQNFAYALQVLAALAQDKFLPLVPFLNNKPLTLEYFRTNPLSSFLSHFPEENRVLAALFWNKVSELWLVW